MDVQWSLNIDDMSYGVERENTMREGGTLKFGGLGLCFDLDGW